MTSRIRPYLAYTCKFDLELADPRRSARALLRGRFGCGALAFMCLALAFHVLVMERSDSLRHSVSRNTVTVTCLPHTARIACSHLEQFMVLLK